MGGASREPQSNTLKRNPRATTLRAVYRTSGSNVMPRSVALCFRLANSSVIVMSIDDVPGAVVLRFMESLGLGVEAMPNHTLNIQAMLVQVGADSKSLQLFAMDSARVSARLYQRLLTVAYPGGYLRSA